MKDPAHILVVDDDFQQQAVALQHGRHAWQEPARHGIGIDGDRQALPARPATARRRRPALQVGQQIRLHQAHLLHMAQQRLASRRGPHLFASHQKPLAQRVFQ